MHEKNSTVVDISAHLGLNIHRGKSKILKVIAVRDTPIMLESKALESFPYLGSIVEKEGGTDADIFRQLKNVWGFTDLSTNTTIRICNTVKKLVLLHGAKIQH